MITAVVTSDCHLGTYYARLRPERLEQRRRRLQQAFAATVDVALARGATLFLIAGDLFDRPDPRNADRLFVAGQFRRLADAGVQIVAIAGNHDSPRSYGYDGGIVPLAEMQALGAVCLLRDDAQMTAARLMVTDAAGNGIPVSVRGMSTSFAHDAKACPLDGKEAGSRQADIDLILLHYAVEVWEQPLAPEPVLSLANLEKLETDAICVGHLHRRNSRRLDSGALLLNPGATEHIHFGEEANDCGCWVLRLSPGKSADAEYVPIAPQPMKTLRIAGEEIAASVGAASAALPPDGEQSPDRLAQASIEQRIAAVADPDLLLRIELTGRLPQALYETLDFAALQQFGQERCFHCQLSADDLTVEYPYGELVFSSGGFEIDREIEEVIRQMEQAVPEAQDRERRVVRDAGSALLAAYQQLRVGG